MPKLKSKSTALIALAGLTVLAGGVWASFDGRSPRATKSASSPTPTATANLPPDHAILSPIGLIRQLPYVCGALGAARPKVAASMELTFAYGAYASFEMPGTGGAVYQTCSGTPSLDTVADDRRLDANATQFQSISIAKASFAKRRSAKSRGSDDNSAALENLPAVGDESYSRRDGPDGAEIDFRIRNVIVWITWRGANSPPRTDMPPDKYISYQKAVQELLPMAKSLVQHCVG